MRSIPANLITAKNSLYDTYPILLLLQIDFTNADESPTLRLVRNTENIVWGSETWTAFPFDIQAVNTGKRSELPSVSLSVSNVNRIMQNYIEEVDGAVDSNVTLTRIHSNNISSSDYFDQWNFIVTETTCNNKSVSFTLSSKNYWNIRVPRTRMRRNVCRWKFVNDGSGRCRYSGAETECNKTFARCVELGNETRYGGYVNIGGGGLKL